MSVVVEGCQWWVDVLVVEMEVLVLLGLVDEGVFRSKIRFILNVFE